MEAQFKRLRRSLMAAMGATWILTTVSIGLIVLAVHTYWWVRSYAVKKTFSEHAQHQGWLESRRHELAATEAGTAALRRARDFLAGTKPTMPIEAAICFEARKEIDLTLRQAMRPGREFGSELTQWHAENRAVEIYCAYALTIGAKR